MWTDEHRASYRRDEARFPSDLTDTEWARLAPLIPDAKPGGRHPENHVRWAAFDIRQNGQWKVQLLQVTAIPPPQK